MGKEPIKIKSSLGAEFNSEVQIGGEKYIVQTEDGGLKNPRIKTRVYLKGRIIYTRQADYDDAVNRPGWEKKVQDLMQRQHQMAISILKAEKAREEKTPSEYLEEVRALLSKEKEKDAFKVLQAALARFPDNSFLLSYYGYLDAKVNKNHADGIALCSKAIGSIKEKVPFGEEFFYPVLFLNLGKAYLAAGKKKQAVDAFSRGLEIDGENSELLGMLRKLGIRKEPTVSFLKRSHAVNKYLGLFMSKVKKP